ncbi:cation transporter [Polaribacter sp.]|uniref:cation transporter n=1 Tax=Polaribacter sp. TaxID=1920175 RepID=UPI004047157F
MRTKNIILNLAVICLVIAGCKKEEKQATLPVEKAQVALNISGMTCEIGCAKTIQSKLSKKEGVLDAKVVFADSIATIEFDANKTSEKDLIAFVNGIAGGDMYKASINKKEAHSCTEKCEKECDNKSATKMECKKDCKMACCADKKS